MLKGPWVTKHQVFHRHIHKFGSFSLAKLSEWVTAIASPWSVPALQVLEWPWAGDKIHHYSFPVAWQGDLGSSVGFLSTLAPGKG